MPRKRADTSYVLTNRKKLDAFLAQGDRIEDLGMMIGQVTGKPKYPAGHVGKRSREKNRPDTRRLIKRQELERRAWVRLASKQLEGLDKEQKKAKRKEWIQWFKAAEKGLGRGRGSFRARGIGRKRKQRVAVARVAGVIASDRSTGQYHEKVMGVAQKVKINPDQMRAAALAEGKTVAQVIIEFAKRKKKELRASFKTTGHEDTGRLRRNIQYMVWTVGGKKAVLQREKRLKSAAKLKKAVRKARKGALPQELG